MHTRQIRQNFLLSKFSAIRYIPSNYSNTRGRRLYQKHTHTSDSGAVDIDQREQLTANYIAMCKSINIV